MKIIKKHKKKFIFLLVLIVIIISFTLFKKSRSSNIKAEILTVQKSNLELKYEVSADVNSKQIIAVFSPSVAEVYKMHHRTDDFVNAGDVLISLKETKDTTNLNIQKVNLRINDLQKQVEAAKKIYAAGGISKFELDTLKSQLNEAVLDKQILKTAETPFEGEIKSPIKGVIISTNADVNYKIDPSKPLFEIADIENLIVKSEVSNAFAKNIKEGQEVSATSDSLMPNEVLKGTVESISKISTKSKLSNELITNITIKLDNYSTLKPGDKLNVSIKYAEIKDQIILLFNYIIFENGKNYVYVVGNDNKLIKKEIVIGRNDGFNFEVVKGLNVNDRVVDNSNNLYKEGDIVK